MLLIIKILRIFLLSVYFLNLNIPKKLFLLLFLEDGKRIWLPLYHRKAKSCFQRDHYCPCPVSMQHSQSYYEAGIEAFYCGIYIVLLLLLRHFYIMTLFIMEAIQFCAVAKTFTQSDVRDLFGPSARYQWRLTHTSLVSILTLHPVLGSSFIPVVLPLADGYYVLL